MSGSYVAEFHHGPCDGLIRALPDLPRTCLFPIMQPVQWINTTDEQAVATLHEPPPTVVYELAYTHGRPTIDGHGRYRYTFAGVR